MTAPVRRVAVLAMMSLVAGAVAAGNASPVDASVHPSTAVRDVAVVLDEPDPPTLYEDNVTHLSGRLSNGSPDRLIVLRRLAAHEWVKIGTTHTDATGAFGFDYTPVDPGTVTLDAIRPTGQGDIVSAPQRLTVLDRRVFLVTKPSYDTFSDIVVTGTTRPRQAHRYIVIQHLQQGRWVGGAHGYTDSDGRYSLTMRNNLPGTWHVRAWWGGHDPGGGTLEMSLVHRYLVNAVLDPVVTSVTRRQLGGSYHAGCPVGPTLLRNIGLTFKTFGPFVHRGTLVVRDTIAHDMIMTFGEALRHGYPLRRVFTAAHYGGSDVASMNHDNTSAFNCRQVTGDPTQLSPHSYGIAVDLDPVENPYQDVHGTWWPKHLGERYRNRSIARPGMLFGDSAVTREFESRGFQWGGLWNHPDYQHFDTLGNGLGRPADRVAGPLDARSMPAPSILGSGWRRFADPGGPEDGWVGNGTFVHARNARGAAVGVLPLGCAARASAALPAPRFALQGSYVSRDSRSAQAVVMQFVTRADAVTYFAGLEQRLLRCTTADGPSGVSVRALHVTRRSFDGVRTYAGHQTWREADRRSGARVTVLLSRR
jgi:D-alanyl-D-alanine carboxypeptidase